MPELVHLAVRRSSDGGLHEEPFRRDKVDTHIADVLFGKKGPLKPRQVHDVADRSVSRIEKQLRTYDLSLRGDEFQNHPAILGALPDHVITDAIEATLRDGHGRRFRMAELLYVMAVRGRVDYRQGWAGARDVMAWILSRYERIEQPAHQRGIQPRDPVLITQTNWRPANVLKKHHPESVFDLAQFRQSITRALHGRAHAGTNATMILHYVLGTLEGQRVVHSSQLADGVLVALRRVDDIGYLRWATVTKNIRSVRSFAVEVADLISSPSPRMEWRYPPS